MVISQYTFECMCFWVSLVSWGLAIESSLIVRGVGPRISRRMCGPRPRATLLWFSSPIKFLAAPGAAGNKSTTTAVYNPHARRRRCSSIDCMLRAALFAEKNAHGSLAVVARTRRQTRKRQTPGLLGIYCVRRESIATAYYPSNKLLWR